MVPGRTSQNLNGKVDVFIVIIIFMFYLELIQEHYGASCKPIARDYGSKCLHYSD